MGGISFPHRTPLIVIDGTLTPQRYINEFLRPAGVSFFTAYRYVEVSSAVTDTSATKKKVLQAV